MATLKLYDGTSWQPVAGQGSPGQGVPSGGSTGTLLAKNSAANFDTTWTPATLAADNVSGASRLRVNSLGASGAGLQVTSPAANMPAIDAWAPNTGQTQQILRVIDQNGNVGWHVDRYARPKQFVQSGNYAGTTDGVGNIAFAFPEVFLSNPIVVGNEASGAAIWLHIYYIATNAVGFTCRTNTGGPVVNGNVRIYWIAVENRP